MNKQTVYIPTKVEDELPPVSTVDKVFFHSLKNGRIRQAIHYKNGELLEHSTINGDDLSVKEWLKPTEAYVFSSEELKQLLSNAFNKGKNSIHFENDGSWWEDDTAEVVYIENLLNKEK